MSKKNKSESKAEKDSEDNKPVELPSNPMLSKISKFDSRQSKIAQENFSKDIHVKKNKIFRGVR